MKTGIVFISKHGTTEKVANMIADKLSYDDVQLINLRKDKIESIDDFDRIIIGGSIHMSIVHKKTKKFYELYRNVLLTKKLGLFMCCMEEGEKAIEQFENAFSEDIRKHSSSTAFLGYEYNLEKMNFFERALVKKISGSKENISEIDIEGIDNFVSQFEDSISKN